jgi:hypothetical protein
MESAQAKPVRRRRRWLIVAFVLVLVSLVSWWYYPRGDTRFVGKWTCTESPGRSLAVITFRHPGRMSWHEKGNRIIGADWRVENGRLLIGSYDKPPPILEDLCWKMADLVDFYWDTRQREYAVRSIEPDQIIFETLPSSLGVATYTLTRIPE